MTIPVSMSVRTFLLAMATDRGPKLIAFRLSNVLIGRLPDNHLSINHASVSRRHARLSLAQTGITLEDLGSQNGTTVNGVPVTEVTNIRPGDIIRIGHIPLFYFGFINPSSPPVPEIVDQSLIVNPAPPTVS